MDAAAKAAAEKEAAAKKAAKAAPAKVAAAEVPAEAAEEAQTDEPVAVDASAFLAWLDANGEGEKADAAADAEEDATAEEEAEEISTEDMKGAHSYKSSGLQENRSR